MSLAMPATRMVFPRVPVARVRRPRLTLLFSDPASILYWLCEIGNVRINRATCRGRGRIPRPGRSYTDRVAATVGQTVSSARVS